MKNLIFSFLEDIKKNYKTLILAFILAFGLWVAASVQIFPTIEISIKGIGIEAQLTDYMVQNNLQIVSSISDTATIRIEGRRYEISDLAANDFFASVNLSEVRSSGSYTLPIVVSAKTNDKDCTILETEPSHITLAIDEIISKEFTVTGTAPDISLPENYYSDNISVSPETITITGSAQTLNKITHIEARSTYHGELSESRQTLSELYIYGANGVRIPDDDLVLSTSNVMVNINILKQKELPLTLSITGYPSNFDISSLKYEILPKTITIAAPDDSIDSLSELNIGTVDISDIQLNKNSNILINLPDGYKNLSNNKYARVEWSLDNYGTADFTVSGENINITNAPDNYDVSLITTEVLLKVIGPSDRILGFAPGDITVNVNLLGISLHTGTQDVGVTVQLKGSKQPCWVSGEYKVTINVTEKQPEEP